MTDMVCPSCGYGQALDELRVQVEALRKKARTRDWDYYSALDDVLDILEGGVNPPDPIFGHDHGQ